MSRSPHGFERSRAPVHFKMFLEPRTLVVLGVCMFMWAVFAIALLQMSGKWMPFGRLIAP